jgi:hypothetical protein
MPNLLLFADDAARIAAYTYAENKIPGQDNNDVSQYGPVKSFIRSERRMRRESFTNNWRPLLAAGSPFFGGVPMIAYSAAHVQRGEVLPTIANSAVGIVSYPAFSAILSPTLRFGLPSVLGAASAPMAAMLAVLPAYGLGVAAKQSVRWFSKFGYRLRHIEQGGDYQDTDTALNLRMRTVSDMSSALSYSRRWLGNEALFMR